MNINDPRFRRTIERIHALGPRALAELCIESSADPETLERYARSNPQTLTTLGGNRWPASIFVVAST